MPDPGEITSLPVESELHICPECGYERGFHISLVSVLANKDSAVKSTRETYRVIFICPECGARFDVNWRVPLDKSENRFEKAPINTAACVPHGSPASCLPAPPRNDKNTPE
jgi:hypothetical protein